MAAADTDPDVIPGAKTVKGRAKVGREQVLERVSIEPSDNGGFIVETRYKMEPPKGKSADQCCGPSWVEPEKRTFETLASLNGYLAETFGEKK